MEYKYIVVHDHQDGWEVEGKLKDGWTIDSAATTGRAVHYVMSHASPESKKDDGSDTAASQEGTSSPAAAEQPSSPPAPESFVGGLDDDGEGPVNLDDIPF